MILDTIAHSTRIRVEEEKKRVPFEALKEKAFSLKIDTPFLFEKALQERELSFICEVKKASPSKGVIAADFPYLQIAQEYETAGASAISVLTEPAFFQGNNTYLSEIKQAVHVPVLRKDFTVDDYQIYEAKTLGADAVLLICSLLDADILSKYIAVCDQLGMSALVEAHTADEVHSALQAGARVIGVNNRNLKTFEVDFHTCIRLRRLVPQNIVFVAESGIQTAQDVALLKEAGVHAVLVGETLMRSKDKKAELNRLKGM
nr:indole-3-glycerol phosphate synthase TrpC [uncultured Caproiciproducens sp.]